jgi:hypothetical protein
MEPSWMRQIQEPILARYDNKVLTEKGIFIVRDEQSLVKKSATPVKDHLRFKQVNFGKDCTIALLPNGNVIGWGINKHRHFKDQPSRCESQKDDEIIPLVVRN